MTHKKLIPVTVRTLSANEVPRHLKAMGEVTNEDYDSINVTKAVTQGLWHYAENPDEYPGFKFAIATDPNDGTMLGFITFDVGDDDYCTLAYISVRKSRREQGVGTQLMQHIAQEANREGKQYVSIVLTPDEVPGIGDFLIKQGMLHIATLENYFEESAEDGHDFWHILPKCVMVEMPKLLRKVTHRSWEWAEKGEDGSYHAVEKILPEKKDHYILRTTKLIVETPKATHALRMLMNLLPSDNMNPLARIELKGEEIDARQVANMMWVRDQLKPDSDGPDAANTKLLVEHLRQLMESPKARWFRTGEDDDRRIGR